MLDELEAVHAITSANGAATDSLGALEAIAKQRGIGMPQATLAWLLAHDSKWQPLLERVNVLLLPEENPDGYRQASPRTHAANLADALLVIHGTADDNVHPQNTLRLADDLVKAGRPFEMAIYTGMV